MTNAEKLKNLLENELLPDLEVAIDEIYAAIDKAKNASASQKEELEELREMRTECYAILDELARKEMEQEEIDALLEELLELKTKQE
jgi:uncharacterized membrane protein YccC